MSRDDAGKKGYELCGGSIRECNYAGNATFYCFEKLENKGCGNNTLTVVRRIYPKIVSFPDYITVYLTLKPESTTNVVIITEMIPEGLEPLWDYSAVTFDEGADGKIKAMPFTNANEITDRMNLEWISKKPEAWNPKTREAKWWILNDPDGIKQQTIMYKLKLSNGSKKYYDFKGSWELSSGETCPNVGENKIILNLSGDWYKCQVNDSEMNGYVNQWRNNGLSDVEILRVIHQCAEIITGNLTKNNKQNPKNIMLLRELPVKANLSSEVTVNLNLEVQTGAISGVVIKERIPGSWNVSRISGEGIFDEKTGEIKWVLYGKNLKTQTLTYTVISNSTAGNYTFNGTCTTLEESIKTISGNGKIIVEKPPVEGWHSMRFILEVFALIVIVLIILILIIRKRRMGRYF